jgi:hypothetical protein
MSTAPVWQSSDEQLLAELGASEAQLHATWAQMWAAVAAIDSRSLAAVKGYGMTVELVRAIARVPRSEARSRVDAAAGCTAWSWVEWRASGSPAAADRRSGGRACDRRG